MTKRKLGLMALSRKSFARLRNLPVLVSSMSTSWLIFWLEANQ